MKRRIEELTQFKGDGDTRLNDGDFLVVSHYDGEKYVTRSITVQDLLSKLEQQVIQNKSDITKLTTTVVTSTVLMNKSNTPSLSYSFTMNGTIEYTVPYGSTLKIYDSSGKQLASFAGTCTYSTKNPFAASGAAQQDIQVDSGVTEEQLTQQLEDLETEKKEGNSKILFGDHECSCDAYKACSCNSYVKTYHYYPAEGTYTVTSGMSLKFTGDTVVKFYPAS